MLCFSLTIVLNGKEDRAVANDDEGAVRGYGQKHHGYLSRHSLVCKGKVHTELCCLGRGSKV